jgi:hypothetical protein
MFDYCYKYCIVLNFSNFFFRTGQWRCHISGVRISGGIWAILMKADTSLAGDTKFVNLLLQTIFGNTILAKSSVTGFSKSNQNQKSEKLDHIKLNLIKGNFFKHQFNLIYSKINTIFPTELFLQRHKIYRCLSDCFSVEDMRSVKSPLFNSPL